MELKFEIISKITNRETIAIGNSIRMDTKFVICINNKGYEVSLERGKVYRVLNDEKASQHNLTRVIDESGEDYLFPNEYFVPIKLPKAAEEALVA